MGIIERAAAIEQEKVQAATNANKIAAYDSMVKKQEVDTIGQAGYQQGLAAASKMDAYSTAIGQDLTGVTASRLMEMNPQDAGMIGEAENQVLGQYRDAINQVPSLAQMSYADQYKQQGTY